MDAGCRVFDAPTEDLKADPCDRPPVVTGRPSRRRTGKRCQTGWKRKLVAGLRGALSARATTPFLNPTTPRKGPVGGMADRRTESPQPTHELHLLPSP